MAFLGVPGCPNRMCTRSTRVLRGRAIRVRVLLIFPEGISSSTSGMLVLRRDPVRVTYNIPDCPPGATAPRVWIPPWGDEVSNRNSGGYCG